MERVGQYVIVRELSVRAYGSVYRARRQDDTDEQGGYLIKVFNPTGAAAGEVGVDPQVRAALDRAAFQQKLAQGGAPHWAPIFDLGMCEEGAYYVSRFYPSSIRRLVEGRVHLQSIHLRAIALGIVDGLIELKTAANRAHGGLSPQSVLIDLNENRQPSGVLLAEPGTEQDASAAGERGDIKAIGQLLYQIITSRAKLDALILPLGPTEEWKYLGAAGKPWLNVVNYLLDAEATSQTHTLEQVRQRIAAIGAGQSGPSKGLVVAAAATVVLAGLAGGGWYAWRRLGSRPTVPPVITTSSNYPAAERLYKTYCPEPKLQQLLGSVSASAFPELSALRSTLGQIRSQGEAGVTEANLKKLDEAIKAAKRWSVPVTLRRLAGEGLPREWEHLSGRINAAADASGGDSLDIASMVAAANWRTALGDYDWKAARERLVGYAADFTRSGYPLLAYFEEFPKDLDKAAAQASEPRSLAAMREVAESSLALAGTLSQAKANPDLAVRVSRPSAERDQVVKDADGEIARAATGRAQAIARVLGTWEERMLRIPAPKDAAVVYEQYKTSLADRRKEYEAVKKWTLANEDDGLMALVNRATDNVEGLKRFVNTNAPEFQDAKDQADRVLKLLQSRIREGDTRRQLFEATNKSFLVQMKQIDDLIPQAVAAGSSNGPVFGKDIAALREEAGRFERDFKAMGDGDIDARKKKLDESLAALFRRVDEEVGTEPRVDIALPKFVHEAMLKELSSRWDEYSTRIVGQTRPNITRNQKALLGPAKANVEAVAKVALELEKRCEVVAGLKASGGVEIQAAAKSLPALALAHGTRLIADAIQIDTRRKKLTIGAVDLLAEQDKWNKAAGQWLACWSEIEKALLAGADPADKLTVNDPQLTDVRGDVTLLKLRDMADLAGTSLGITAADDPLGPLRGRLKALEDVERRAVPANDAQRGPWLRDMLDTLKTDRLELAAAAARKIASAGAPWSVQDFKDLDAARKLMSAAARSKLDPSLDAAVASALTTFARQGLRKTETVEATVNDLSALAAYARQVRGDQTAVQTTAKAMEDLKTKLGLAPGAFDNDIAIKTAVSEFARNGLKDAATVESTAKTLVNLRANMGLADDVYRNDSAVQSALVEFTRKGLRDATTVESTVALMEKVSATMGFPPEIDGKDAVVRFNLSLCRARRSQLKDTDNSAAATLVQDLLRPDAGLGGQVDVVLVTSLRDQLAAWTRYQSQLGAKGGPKDAHFTLNVRLSNDDVKVFEKQVAGEMRRLVFGRIIVGGDAAFLCTTETPIWAVDALVENGKKLGDVLGLDAPVSGTRPVPRPWFTDPEITELRIRPGWLPKYTQGFTPYPDALRNPAAPEKLAAPSANPGKDQPLDWITPEVARGIAIGLGCRLATSAEWRAGAAEQTNLPNLRDSSWEQVANQLNQAPNKESIIPRPCLLEKISFAPSNGIVAWERTALATAVTALGLTPKWNLPGGAYDDRHPFFWPADPELDANPGGKPKYRDLIGNVGEYVVDADGQIHIAGGSALSDPADGLGVQKTAAPDGIGHADVGLRLAFTPAKEGPPPEIARNVKRLLDGAKYVTAGSP